MKWPLTSEDKDAIRRRLGLELDAKIPDHVTVCPTRTTTDAAWQAVDWKTQRDRSFKRNKAAPKRKAASPAFQRDAIDEARAIEATRRQEVPVDKRRHPERDAKLIELAANGATMADAHRATGLSKAGVYLAAKRLEIKFRRAPRKAQPRTEESKAIDKKIAALAADGLSRREIAKALGMRYTTVDNRCRKANIETRGSSAPQPDAERDLVVVKMCRANATGAEIRAATGLSLGGLQKACIRLGVEYRRVVKRPPRRPVDTSFDARVTELVGEGVYMAEIGRQIGLKPRQVKAICARLRLSPAPGPRGGHRPARSPRRQGKADVARAERAERARDRITDRRRFIHSPVPTGAVKIVLDADHPAAVAGETIHVHRRLPIDTDRRVLIDGKHNAKIGGDVTVGRLRGARIFTVTLEERATCPRACGHWRTCYGNADTHARRWQAGEAFETRLEADVIDACADGDLVLVRLHYLGDFYSVPYVALWGELLGRFENLNVFGFTAHPPESEIGQAISELNEVAEGRSWIRFSGRTGPMGSTTLDFPTQKKKIGDMLVCPEQRDAMSGREPPRFCGSCAACWESNVGIVFVEH